MEMPKYSELVRLVAQIGAAIGVIGGLIFTVMGFGAFRFGFMAGLTAVSGGLYMIFGAIAALGLVYCFLALVQAQIDTRNAVVNFISASNRANR